ncbi:hypothetical protein KIT90_00540 [Vibrio sp. B172a]|uniref:hypothetical protein n=1 Tax=Vibrio sp. B172a TaxID=2835790 RepID=UPI002552F6F2|nr:hypothetical protein [Vibrio sp. B172a]MDK9779855.1 hypothetical protein [Vibrio sp. B172a]
MNRKKLIFLFSLSFSGWFFSGFLLYNYMEEQRDHLESMVSENAYNIVAQAIQEDKSQEDIIASMEFWFENNWTAQTGSVTTLCKFGRDKLKRILTDEGVTTVCRLNL